MTPEINYFLLFVYAIVCLREGRPKGFIRAPGFFENVPDPEQLEIGKRSNTFYSHDVTPADNP